MGSETKSPKESVNVIVTPFLEVIVSISFKKFSAVCAHQLRVIAVMMNYRTSQSRGRILTFYSWAFQEVQVECLYLNIVLFLVMNSYF